MEKKQRWSTEIIGSILFNFTCLFRGNEGVTCYFIFDLDAVVPLLLALRRIASVKHPTELRIPCPDFRRYKLLRDTFCFGWNIIAVNNLRSAKHISNGIPLHKLYGFVVTIISVLLK